MSNELSKIHKKENDDRNQFLQLHNNPQKFIGSKPFWSHCECTLKSKCIFLQIQAGTRYGKICCFSQMKEKSKQYKKNLRSIFAEKYHFEKSQSNSVEVYDFYFITNDNFSQICKFILRFQNLTGFSFIDRRK